MLSEELAENSGVENPLTGLFGKWFGKWGVLQKVCLSLLSWQPQFLHCVDVAAFPVLGEFFKD